MKPTVTNARYRVAEWPYNNGYSLHKGSSVIGIIFRMFLGCKVYYLWLATLNGKLTRGYVDAAQAALDALVAAYEGNGEAGE